MYIKNFSDLEDLGRQLAFVGMTNIKVSERMISKKPRMEEWDGSVDEYLDIMAGKTRRMKVYSIDFRGYSRDFMSKGELLVTLNQLISRM